MPINFATLSTYQVPGIDDVMLYSIITPFCHPTSVQRVVDRKK